MAENAVAAETAMPAHGEFCWSEIVTNNVKDSQKFYSEIFGWIFSNNKSDNGYIEFGKEGEAPLGGMFEMTEEICGGTPPPPHFMNYIAVDNVDEIAGKAFELGATIVKAPENIPNVGRFSIIKDPTGAMFAVISL